MAPKSDKDSSAKTGKKRTVTPWGVGRTLTWLFVLVAVAVAIVSLLRSRDGDKKFEPKQGVPTEASAKQLREFASPQRPVYWAGPASSGRLELTTTAKAVYVRYCPKA